MKNNKKNSAVSEFIAGKGFYIALFVSIAMIGTACYFAYTQTSNNITNQLNNLSSVTSSDTDNNYNEEVGKEQTNISKETTIAETEEPNISNNEKAELGDNAVRSYSEVPVQANNNAKQPIAMPLEGEILEAFSNGELVKSPTTGTWQTHNGIDIAANLGDQVRAMTSGTITEIINDPLFGVTVVIDHNDGIIGRYSNLNEGVTVEVGLTVSGGTAIGTIGDTADIESNQPYHLHFEVTKEGQYIDPTSLITK